MNVVFIDVDRFGIGARHYLNGVARLRALYHFLNGTAGLNNMYVAGFTASFYRAVTMRDDLIAWTIAATVTRTAQARCDGGWLMFILANVPASYKYR